MNAAFPNDTHGRDTGGAQRGPFTDVETTSDERTYALLNHLAGLSSLLLASIPFVSLAAVLIMWLAKKNSSPFIDDHGADAVNFQLSILLWYIVGIVLGVVFGIVTLGIGFAIFAAWPLFVVAMTILNAVGCIRGAYFASKGMYYRYPVTARFIER